MLNELSLAEAAARIASGEITSERLVRDCLDRIERREPTVHAWAFLDPVLALEQARARDRADAPLGPLHGVPVGIKDIIDTADMPTQMGSPIYEGNRPPSDATCVSQVRAAGAVVLGKTVTVEFAGMAPPVTCNPHDPAHTPGGSSSGSAAAVADFMVPAAFGTQTAGSIHRPAAYCGVIGYKPSYHRYGLRGVWPAAQSLDTLGLLTRTMDDVELLDAVLTGRPAGTAARLDAPPRIAVCRTHLWDTTKPETRAAIEDAAARLAAAGAEISRRELPAHFAGLTEARNLISNYERARATAYEWHNHRDLLSAPLRAAVERGFGLDYEEYAAAQRLATRCRAELDAAFDGIDALLAPCVMGEAPVGLDSTGDHAFVGFWNLLHAPSFALPTHRGPNGMPLGLHLVSRFADDARVMAVARWVLEALSPAA